MEDKFRKESKNVEEWSSAAKETKLLNIYNYMEIIKC